MPEPLRAFQVASPAVAGRRREQLLALYGLGEPEAGTIDELADIVDLARHVTGSDGSQVNVIGAERQLTLHEIGRPSPTPSIPLSDSVCSTVLDHRGTDRLVVIPDTAAEPLLRHHPAVTGPAGIGFYAGVPLRSSHGWPMGMLCVWSSAPRVLDELQSRLLRQLGNAATQVLETRRRAPARPSRHDDPDGGRRCS